MDEDHRGGVSDNNNLETNLSHSDSGNNILNRSKGRQGGNSFKKGTSKRKGSNDQSKKGKVSEK